VLRGKNSTVNICKREEEKKRRDKRACPPQEGDKSQYIKEKRKD